MDDKIFKEIDELLTSIERKLDRIPSRRDWEAALVVVVVVCVAVLAVVI